MACAMAWVMFIIMESGFASPISSIMLSMRFSMLSRS